MTSTVTQTRRKFSRLVDDPVLEDYSLRYAPSTFRRWSEFTVAMSALGGIASSAPTSTRSIPSASGRWRSRWSTAVPSARSAAPWRRAVTTCAKVR